MLRAASALKSVCGIDNAFMHGVAPLKPGCHMAGPAYTLRYIPARADLDERTDMPHGGIANSVTQPVEFNLTDPQRVAVESETRCGTMGAILATRMAVRGCVGLV
jgi:regulator of RNase E activity RraA